MHTIDGLIKKIDEMIPSWSYFAIEKRGKFWYVSVKIDSAMTKDFSFDHYDSSLRHALETTHKMLHDWAYREVDLKEDIEF